MQLLAARGSTLDDERERKRCAYAVVRAAVELEASVAPVRSEAYAESGPVLIAVTPAHAEYARRLGRATDALVREDPLPSPGRVADELGLVPVPEGLGPMPPGRALRLAAAASSSAALSARLELYPRGMSALSALRLSLGALSGPDKLTDADLRARVRGRFPEAADLPPRPELDSTTRRGGRRPRMADCGRWHERLRVTHGRGHRQRDRGGVALSDHCTAAGNHASRARCTRAGGEARARSRTGAFLALTVEPRRTACAEEELLRRFPREVVSLTPTVIVAIGGNNANNEETPDVLLFRPPWLSAALSHAWWLVSDLQHSARSFGECRPVGSMRRSSINLQFGKSPTTPRHLFARREDARSGGQSHGISRSGTG